MSTWSSRKVCGDLEAALPESSGEHDHVHLLAEYPAEGAGVGAREQPQGVSARRAVVQRHGRCKELRQNPAVRSSLV
jgi:REP element-mobilizing transposase RayT